MSNALIVKFNMKGTKAKKVDFGKKKKRLTHLLKIFSFLSFCILPRLYPDMDRTS